MKWEIEITPTKVISAIAGLVGLISSAFIFIMILGIPLMKKVLKI